MTMYIKQSHSATDRTPYTYLIGWTELDVWYYGRRTAKNCHPEELFISYFTSSDIVAQVREEHGEPDIIKVHMYYSNIDACKIQEERFLKRMNAAMNLRFLNQSNGDRKWDRTGLVSVKDDNGNSFTVNKDDPRIKSGELVNVLKGVIGNKRKKGFMSARDPFGQCFEISITDPKYLSGYYVPIHTGFCNYIEISSGNTIRASTDDPRIKLGELKGVGKPKGSKDKMKFNTNKSEAQKKKLTIRNIETNKCIKVDREEGLKLLKTGKYKTPMAGFKKPVSEEQKKNQSIKMKGRPAHNKGVIQPKCSCIICNKELSGQSIYVHFNSKHQ